MGLSPGKRDLLIMTKHEMSSELDYYAEHCTLGKTINSESDDRLL